MKSKKIDSKLNLSKKTIANLDRLVLNHVKGGYTIEETTTMDCTKQLSCVGCVTYIPVNCTTSFYYCYC
jgi:hypothetical protein